MSADTEQRRAIVRLLALMRDGKEVRAYLQRFSKIDQSRFAVIKVGGAILRDERDTLADALAFLQTVGLTPVVVHGGGPQLDQALKAAGVPEDKRGGLRVTTPEVLRIARDVFTAENLALVDAVRAAGARAAAIPTGVFEADLMNPDEFGLVGAPRAARLELVESAARAGAIPILTSLGTTPEGQIVNVNADQAVRALVLALEPYKVVFLTGTGGVLNEKGEILTTINLATEYDDLVAQDWLHGGMRLKLDEIKELLEHLPLTSSVSITRPDALAQELFTHGGAGTLVRRGERILTAEEKSGLDSRRVHDLVAQAFGRSAAPDWWENLELARGYVTENYRAGAFVSQVGDAAYLDKFAVLEEARGEGLGQAVWRRMVADWPRLVWRARTDNPVNDFYFRQAHGSARRGPWTVFWRGIDDLGEAKALVEVAVGRPATLMDAPS